MKKTVIIIIFITIITVILKPVFAQQPTSLPLASPFGFREITSLGGGTTNIVKHMFPLGAALVTIYFLVAAFKYLKAGANKEDVEGARQMITHSIIGFVILMFAFLILQYLLDTLFGIKDFKIIG